MNVKTFKIYPVCPSLSLPSANGDALFDPGKLFNLRAPCWPLVHFQWSKSHFIPNTVVTTRKLAFALWQSRLPFQWRTFDLTPPISANRPGRGCGSGLQARRPAPPQIMQMYQVTGDVVALTCDRCCLQSPKIKLSINNRWHTHRNMMSNSLSTA